MSFSLSATLYHNADGYALHDVEDVFILRAVGGGFLLLGVAVKVQEKIAE
jgi:hypothetical protein